jgi:steroid 5-alpha reductase family enzyme
MLKEKTKVFYPIINFIGIHMVPTLVVFLCCLPIIFLFEQSNNFNVGTIIFFIGAILSVILQGVSDITMHKYKKNKTTPFIRDGVWKYSRHPNYLAEILMWWNIGLLCVSSLLGYWYILIGAIANTMLFLFVSIPLADGKQSKKEGFLEYKKQTRMLLPIKK